MKHLPSFSPFKAAIFDMDGLMLDTESQTFRCINIACHEHGLEFPLDLYTKLIGRRASDCPKIIYEYLGNNFPLKEIIEQSNVIRNTQISQGIINKKPGIDEILDHLSARGIALGVATSTHHEEAVKLLSLVDLFRWFSVIVGGNQVSRSKPEPDIFCEAAAQLGARPNECVVFEDSEAGVTAASAAGMRVIMVPDMKQPSSSVIKLPYAIVSSLHEALELISS